MKATLHKTIDTNIKTAIIWLCVSHGTVWVKVTDSWKAINTTDRTSGKTRGFVLVSKPAF
ncbi:hypothetical protein [Fortiea sp. LEGE XX443]|uniref:hypothetical protein n=1 Tax=Fortiea sp. LEGE XX443 TaxID=1828611 RepID=UPI00351C7999